MPRHTSRSALNVRNATLQDIPGIVALSGKVYPVMGAYSESEIQGQLINFWVAAVTSSSAETPRGLAPLDPNAMEGGGGSRKRKATNRLKAKAFMLGQQLEETAVQFVHRPSVTDPTSYVTLDGVTQRNRR